MKNLFSKQKDALKIKLKAAVLSLFFVVCVFSPAKAFENAASEFDPLTVLNSWDDPNYSVYQGPVKRFSLDIKQTQTFGNIASNFEEYSKTPYLFLAKGPTTPQTKLLWKARITAPKPNTLSKSKVQLEEMIEKVSSLEFKSPEKPKTTIEVEPPLQTDQQEQTASEKSASKPQTIDQTEKRQISEIVTDKTMEKLKNLMADPNKIENPFQLAETLFDAACYRQAGICYTQALKNLDPEDNENKAWILFQVANCLRQTDKSAALEAYTKLIEQHPNCPWIDLAKAQSRLMNFHLTEKPENMIKPNVH